MGIRSRLLTVVAIVALSMVGLVGIGTMPADASSCTPTTSNHCYAIAYWFSTPSTYGSSGVLYSHCLYNDNAPTNFTDQEIWSGTNGSTGLNYWIEVGGQYGLNDTYGNRHWFWANKAPTFFDIHFPSTSFNLDTNYKMYVIFIGSNDWLVDWANNADSATAYSNPPPGKALEAGVEYTTDHVRSVGNIHDLGYWDTSYNFVSGWSGAGVHGAGFDTATASLNSSNTEVSWSTPC